MRSVRAVRIFDFIILLKVLAVVVCASKYSSADGGSIDLQTECHHNQIHHRRHHRRRQIWAWAGGKSVKIPKPQIFKERCAIFVPSGFSTMATARCVMELTSHCFVTARCLLAISLVVAKLFF